MKIREVFDHFYPSNTLALFSDRVKKKYANQSLKYYYGIDPKVHVQAHTSVRLRYANWLLDDFFHSEQIMQRLEERVEIAINKLKEMGRKLQAVSSQPISPQKQIIKLRLEKERALLNLEFQHAVIILREWMDENFFPEMFDFFNDYLQFIHLLLSKVGRKIRAIAKAISLVYGSIDKRLIFKIKATTILRVSEDDNSQ